MTLRLGTRASRLAMTQSEQVAAKLREIHAIDVELVPISTSADKSTASLKDLAAQQNGVFVAALREVVVARDVDFAVHSLKDIPTQADPRLTLAAVPRRADARDVLVARDGLDLVGLHDGARIGTGSPRRASQLRALGRGFEIVDIRGNGETRMARVGEDLDAVVIAAAGLERLGMLDRATEVLDPILMLPAPGQGALACECRADDTETTRLLAALDDPDTRATVTAERALLATLEAGCSAPVGALAEIALGDDGDELWLRAVVGDTSGAPTIRRSTTGTTDQARELGEQLAREMLTDGADRIMASSNEEDAS
ncbi:MAG: hydroxymethylbilane synthase [Actinomycetales bacterium]|nr:hydroxymethylbilane synthase [Actinomycetales bacterium]